MPRVKKEDIYYTLLKQLAGVLVSAGDEYVEIIRNYPETYARIATYLMTLTRKADASYLMTLTRKADTLYLMTLTRKTPPTALSFSTVSSFSSSSMSIIVTAYSPRLVLDILSTFV